MRLRMWALAAIAWIAVVIVGSELTWLAIDRAGQQVSGTAVFAAITPTPAPTPTPTPTPSTKPTPSHRPKPTPSRPPIVIRPSSRPTSVVPPPRTPIRSKPQIGSWSGAAGSVTVSCTGQTAHLIGASPNNGWQVQPGDVSGSSIEVQFTKPGAQVQVQATCGGGVPAFQVDGSGSGDN